MPGHRGITRVLHVVQSLGTGGLENGVVNLANRLDHRRFVIDILCLRFVGELRQRLTNGTEVFFEERTADSIALSIQAIRRLCRQRRYEIVHTHGWATLLPGFVGSRLAGRARVINSEHGTFFTDTARRRLLQRALFRLVDGNSTVSASLRSEMQRSFGLPGSSVTTIINGVDVDRFRPDAARRLQARRKLGIGEDDVLFGTVGRLVPVKDYLTLVRAFGTAVRRCPNAALLIVGDGPDADTLRAAADDLCGGHRIAFVGNRDDVPSLMNAMDVFCLTSLREGLSNTLLESHACGLPAIATDTGGNPEVVQQGMTGFLFPVGAQNELAELMVRLANEKVLRERFGEAARQRAVSEFSIARMVREYEAMYERFTG